MVVHACNPSTHEAGIEGSQVPGQPVLYSKFKASLGYKGTEKERERERGERDLFTTFPALYYKREQLT
jgi:hypothetical protein